MDQSQNLAAIPKSEEQLLIEKRLRRQTKNKLKKEELKRMKEEEKRRKLYEPKDQRVKVVNRNELATAYKPQETLSSSTKPLNAPPVISPDDFPSLGSSKSKFKDRILRAAPSSVNNASAVTETSRTVESTRKVPIPSEETRSPTSDITQGQKNTLNKDPLSKPKRKDPIQIDVLTAIKKCELPKVQHDRIPHTKKESITQRCGNQLDASNPERKKGKVREIPKTKKPSHLKQVILQERDAKKRIVQGDTSEVDTNLNILPDKGSEVTSELQQQTFSPNNDLNTSADLDKEGNPAPVQEVDKLVEATDSSQNGSPLKFPANRSIHNRKFREYCDHSLSQELDSLLSRLITDIVKFQDRAYFNDPIKAHAKRRFVLGFREAKKYLTLKKLKLLIFAPDLENIKSEGGIDDLIEQLKKDASNQDVPYVFGLGRRNLKKLTNKSFKLHGISCIGILNYEGTQDSFNEIRDLLPSLREDFKRRQECLNLTGSHENVCVPQQKDQECKSEEAQEKEEDLELVATFLTKLKELHKG